MAEWVFKEYKNSIWKILPGFITWTIWKERNRRVFQNEHRNIEHSQETLTQNIRQLILVKCRAEPDNQASARDLCILKAFKLEDGRSMGTTNCQQKPSTASIGWNRPPVGFLKLNFDGASRGNPGLAGIGGIIRNNVGEILHIYSKSLGEGTNNQMEFVAMERGLRILINNQVGTAVVEGDTELAIIAARKLYRGAKASKVTKHWRLAKVTENFMELLGEMKGLIFQAVRRKANTVVDHLADHGIEHPNTMWDSCWQNIHCPKLKEKCVQLSKQDLGDNN